MRARTRAVPFEAGACDGRTFLYNHACLSLAPLLQCVSDQLVIGEVHGRKQGGGQEGDGD